MKRCRRFDAAVIGAGVIGTSTAYFLARRKLRVVVLEARHVTSGTSGACDGFVFIQSKKPGIHLESALASVRLFHELRHQLPVDMEYRPCGGLIVAETPEERDALEQFVRDQQRSGLDVRLLGPSEIRRTEPHLSEHILGASYCPADGQVNPLALTLGLASGAREMGAEIVEGAEVTEIETKGGQGFVIRTPLGTFDAAVVVNAAGVSASKIAAMVGLRLPIRPRRGQILVTEPCRPVLRHCLLSARYIAAKYDPSVAEKGDEGCAMEQTRRGNLLLGSTREFVGFDRKTTPSAMKRIARNACRIVPVLRKIHVIRSFAGLRPYTPDGLPILGPVSSVPGFFVAAGHEGDGIALAPITGHLTAQAIVDGRTEISLHPFRPERFQQQKAEKPGS